MFNMVALQPEIIFTPRCVFFPRGAVTVRGHWSSGGSTGTIMIEYFRPRFITNRHPAWHLPIPSRRHRTRIYHSAIVFLFKTNCVTFRYNATLPSSLPLTVLLRPYLRSLKNLKAWDTNRHLSLWPIHCTAPNHDIVLYRCNSSYSYI